MSVEPRRAEAGARDAKMVTMRDVAELANVSKKTVSRVFNDDPHVLPETRARVDAALRALNYVPNTLATTFRMGRPTSIGVAVPAIDDPFFATIVAAVDEEAKHHDLSSVVTSLGTDPTRETAIVESLLRRQLSGLVIAPIAVDHHYLRPWLERVPMVFVDRPPSGVAADSFTEDDAEGAFMATRHLIDHGHSRIAFVGGDLLVPPMANRLAGYRRALLESGVEFDPGLIAVDGSEDQTTVDAFWRVLVQQQPTAVFSSNARTSMTLIGPIKQSGLPVVGFGDFPMADVLTPSLTVVDQDPARLGRLAAQRVIERMQHPSRRLRRKTVLPVQLIERESCRSGDESVAALSA